MPVTPESVQAQIDAATVSLQKVTGRYNPTGKYWKPALAELAAARSDVGQLVAPAPTPAPPSGSVLFDGRAAAMASIDSYQTDQAHANLGPTPAGEYFYTEQAWTDLKHPLWDCVCYGYGSGHNFILQADPHYGNVFKITCKIGDTNQWHGNTGGTHDGAAQLSRKRVLHSDGWTWFALGVMVPAWVGDPANLFFFDLASLGYQTSQGDQVALRLNGDAGKLQYAISQNAGYANNPSGWATGSVAYETPFLPVTFGQWDEFCVGIKASTGDTGEVQVHHRTQGGSWSQVLAHQGATELYGVTPEGTFPQNIEGQEVIDKIGMYYGLHDQTVVTQTVYETGMVPCTDLATAQATFPV